MYKSIRIITASIKHTLILKTLSGISIWPKECESSNEIDDRI